MKFLLISLNVLLVVAVAHLAWKYSSDPVAFPSKTKIAPRSVSEIVGKKPSANQAHKKNARIAVESPEVTERKIDALVKRNVFNTERVPDAPANKNSASARAAQQVRADMSLVGTYTIGDSLGAIILQRLQGNTQQQLKALQQKEYEQYQASATRVTDPGKKAEAATDSKAASEDGEGEDDGTGKKTVVMGNTTISANNVFRQHLKVGDTTVNGYTLVEVTRTSAVLTKDSERIELSLLKPSEAGNIARQRQTNNNNNNARNNNNNNNGNNNRNNNNARNNNNGNNNRNNNNARNNNNGNNNRNNNARNNNNSNNNRNNNNNNRNGSRDDLEWF